ncbi:MAG: CAP domain-containing protein, partial [Chloroflexota bacterium]
HGYQTDRAMGFPPARRYGARHRPMTNLPARGTRYMSQPTALTRTMPAARGRTAALLLSIAFAAAALTSAAPVRAAGGDGLRREANEHRVDGRLNPVVGTALLDDIAAHRAAQMVAAGKMQHNIDYVYDRLNASGTCWKGFGEIIAWNMDSPYSYSHTVQQWWQSKTHHDFIMTAAYNAAGGAWKTARDGGNYSVMVFAVLCGDAVASTAVSLLRLDNRYDPDRRMVFREGTFTGYRLSKSGNVLGKKSVRFGSIRRTTSAGRTRLDGRAWLKVSGGPLDGYWVRETPDSFVRGTTMRRPYDPSRRLVVRPGRYSAYRFSWLGAVERKKVLGTASRLKMRTSARAVINGRCYFLVSSGRLDGYWLRDSDRVILK